MGKNVNNILKGICTDLGYVKKNDAFLKPITYNVWSTIRFSTSTRHTKGHCFVAPFIGLHFCSVEKILCEILKKKPECQSTIFDHIGYLMPDSWWKTWEFLENEPNSPKLIDDLKEAIQKYSMVYYERFPDIESLISYIADEGLSRCNYQYPFLERIPVLYYLANNKQFGRYFIDRALKKNSNISFIFTDEYISNYMKLPDNPEDIKVRVFPQHLPSGQPEFR